MKLTASMSLLVLLGLYSLGLHACAAPSSKISITETPAAETSEQPSQSVSDNDDADLVASSETAPPSNTEPSNTEPFNTVPPGGTDSLTPDGLSYFQGMGPLEYATRLTGEPDYPTWRVRLRLIPQNTGEPDGFSYRVKVDHYNLSPELYTSLVASYGDNTDPSLNDNSPHQSFELAFAPVMSIAADWLSERSQTSQRPITENPPCNTAAQLTLGCADLIEQQLDDAEWQENGSLALESAPWETDVEPLHSMIRLLAQQAGRLDGSGNSAFWTDGEIAEGSSEARPWIEVLIDNYPGNGGGYQGFWIERAADDSIRAVVHRAYYGGVGTGTEGLTAQAVVCGRGEVENQIRTICP